MGEALTLAVLMTLKDEISKGLGGVKQAIGGVGSAALALGGAAVAGVAVLGAALLDAGKAAAEEQVGVERMGAAVRASGGDWDTASAAIESYLAAELERTALDDGAGRDAITRLTTATGDYTKALELMPLAQDLARAKGMDLAAASEIVGKVAAGNTGILGRYGIVLEKGASSTEALGAMQERFAGQAEAYGNTYAGQQEKMQIAMGNLKETIGGLVLPIMTRLAETMADLAQRAMPYVEAAIAALTPAFQGLEFVVNAISSVFMGLGNEVPWEDVLPAWLADIAYQISDAFANIGVTSQATFPMVQGLIADATALFQEKFAFIKDWIDANLPLIQLTITTVLNAIRVVWETVWPLLQTILMGVWENIKLIISSAIDIVLGIIQLAMNLITGNWQGAWDSIKFIFETVWNLIVGMLTNYLNTILGLLGTNLTEVSAAITTTWNNIVSFFTTTWSTIQSVFSGALNSVLTAVGRTWANIWSATTDAWQTIVAWLGNKVSGIWQNAIKPGLDLVWTNVRTFWTTLFDNIHIKTPHFKIKWQDVFGVNIPVGVSVSWYGKGGDFMANGPMLIGVGEAGPERVQITPMGGPRAGSTSGGNGGATWQLTYIDQRPQGGPPNILSVARRLEWEAQMRG